MICCLLQKLCRSSHKFFQLGSNSKETVANYTHFLAFCHLGLSSQNRNTLRPWSTPYTRTLNTFRVVLKGHSIAQIPTPCCMDFSAQRELKILTDIHPTDGVELMLQLCIREVPSSNLDRKNRMPRFLFMVSLSPSRKMSG